jgi:hypothetical protein
VKRTTPNASTDVFGTLDRSATFIPRRSTSVRLLGLGLRLWLRIFLLSAGLSICLCRLGVAWLGLAPGLASVVGRNAGPNGLWAGEIALSFRQRKAPVGCACAVADFTSRHREARRMTIDPALWMSARGELMARPPVKLGVILLPAMQPQSRSIVESTT